MRKFKLVFYAVGAVGFLLAAAAVALTVLGMPTYEVDAPDLRVEHSEERVGRGRRLTHMLCVGCHYNTAEQRLQGGVVSRVPWRIGTLRTPNITAHREQGIGAWSEGDIALALRTGVHPQTKELLLPVMPRWPRMATEDLDAIVAFLRSEDPIVAPSDTSQGAHRITLWAKFYARVRWRPLPYPEQDIAPTDQDDPVAYGQYLVDDVLQCRRCHNQVSGALEYTDVRGVAGYLGGGAPLTGVALATVTSANLTPHASGLSDWTAGDLRHALIDGFTPDGRVLRWPMRRFNGLTPRDVEAIYAYLRTVKPVDRVVSRPQMRHIGAVADPGLHAFQKYECVHCHGDDGEGLADLRGVAEAFPTDAALVAFLKDPEARYPNTVMPKWDGVVAEEDYAALAEYCRRLAEARAQAFGARAVP